MEVDILRMLNYNLGRPHPLTFLRRYSKLMGTTKLIHNLAKYFIEASYLSVECRSLLPSQCAVGALALAAKVRTDENVAAIWSPVMENFSWYSHNRVVVFAEQVLKNVMSYNSLCSNGSGSHYEAVKEKYASNCYEAVTTQPWLLERLEALAKKPKLD